MESLKLFPSQAFVTLSYLNIMRMPMSMLPYMIIALVQAAVSLKRVNKYMNNDELDDSAVYWETSGKDAITVKDGTFRWESDAKPILKVKYCT